MPLTACYCAWMFAVLADPTRRQILELLAVQERSVGELVLEIQQSQPTISKHLRILRDAGFVDVRVAAQLRYYRLRYEPFEQLDEWLTTFRRSTGGRREP